MELNKFADYTIGSTLELVHSAARVWHHFEARSRDRSADVSRSRLGWHEWHGVIRYRRAIKHVGLAQLCSIMPEDTMLELMQVRTDHSEDSNSIDVSPML